MLSLASLVRRRRKQGLLLLHALVFLGILYVGRGFTPRVLYVSYSAPIPANNTLSVELAREQSGVLTEVNSADDSPFARIELPFAFAFLGYDRYRVFASPNGALHMKQNQPCLCSCWMDYECDFNISYRNMLSIYNTDLYPFASKLANVTFRKTASSLTISYANIPFFAEDNSTTNSFRATLHADSSIQLFYDDIVVPSPKQVFYISGLRGSLTGNTNVQWLQSQLNHGLWQWQTIVPGVYPNKDIDFQSGRVWTACPISTTWTSYPAYFDISLASTTTTHVELVPLSISCLHSLEFAAYLSIDASLKATSTDVVKCSISQGNKRSLLCPIMSLPNLTKGAKTLLVAWRAAVSSSQSADFTPLSINALNVTLFGATPTSSQKAAAGNCSLNNPSLQKREVGGSTKCSACSLFNIDFSCLNLPCPLNTSTFSSSSLATNNQLFVNDSSSILYRQPTCLLVGDASCNSSLVVNAVKNTCCPYEQTDCNGICGGGAVVAKNTAGATICCFSSSVDCFGICGGTAQTDACGTCGGHDFQGASCSTSVQILPIPYFASLPYTLIAKINVSVSQTLFSAITFVNFTNLNSTPVAVSLGVKPAANALGPEVFVSSSIVTVQGFTSVLFPVNVSFAKLLLGTQVWQPRALVFSYSRPSIAPSTKYNFHISLLSEAVGCDSLTNYKTCMALPGCLYCLSYPYMRILSAENSSSLVSSERSLFANIVPSQVQNKPILLNQGNCVDGFDSSTVCHNHAPRSFSFTTFSSCTLFFVSAIVTFAFAFC